MRYQVGQARVALDGAADDVGEAIQRCAPLACACADEGQHALDGRRVKLSAFGEVATLVLAPAAEEVGDPLGAQPVELVDGAQHAQPLALAGHAGRSQQPVQQLAAVDLHQRLPALVAGGLQPLDQPGDLLGVGLRPGGAVGVGVALAELAQMPRAGFSRSARPAPPHSGRNRRGGLGVLGHESAPAAR